MRTPPPPSAQLVVLTCWSAKSAVNFLQHAEFPLENAVTLNGGVLARSREYDFPLFALLSHPSPVKPTLPLNDQSHGMEWNSRPKKTNILPIFRSSERNNDTIFEEKRRRKKEKENTIDSSIDSWSQEFVQRFELIVASRSRVRTCHN